MAFEIPLFLALHAIGVTLVGLCHFVLLVLDTMPAPPGGRDVMTLQAGGGSITPRPALSRLFATFFHAQTGGMG